MIQLDHHDHDDYYCDDDDDNKEKDPGNIDKRTIWTATKTMTTTNVLKKKNCKEVV